MRKLVLLAAAVPLLFTPTALATDSADTKPSSSCPPPEISHRYDQERLAINARLRATDCPARENSEFMLAAQITRFDKFGATDRIERAVMCGPFPTMAGMGREDTESYFFCEVDVALDHPPVETIHYDIDVAYPGEHSARNTTLILGCDSDGETAFCED